MTFEVRFDIVNAIIHSPVESMILIAMVIFAWKFFGIGDRHRRHEMWHDFIFFWTYHVRYALPRLIDNRDYSFCRIEVDCIDRVFMIIKTRYAFQWRQRSIIAEETGLSNSKINQIVEALLSQGRIEIDEKHRWVIPELLVSPPEGVKN